MNLFYQILPKKTGAVYEIRAIELPQKTGAEYEIRAIELPKETGAVYEIRAIQLPKKTTQKNYKKHSKSLWNNVFSYFVLPFRRETLNFRGFGRFKTPNIDV